MPDFVATPSKLTYQLTFEGLWPTSVAWLGSGRRLAATNQLGQIYIWDLPESPPELPKDSPKDRTAPNVFPVRRLDGHTNEISRLLVTPDGKHLISASLDRSIRVWPLDVPAADKAEAILDAETRKRDAKRSGKKDAALPGVTVETQTACEVLSGHEDWIYALGISADGKRIISGDVRSQVIVWDLESRKSISKWLGHPWNWVIAAALSPDGETALVSEHRYKRDDFDIPTPALKTWSVTDGKEKLDILKVQFPKINAADRTYGAAQVWRKFVANGLVAAAFSPDGQTIAAAQGGETDTGKVHLLEAATGKLIRDVSGHQYGATDVLFSADGKFVLSAGRDTTVRIGHVEDGKEAAVLGSPRGGQFKDWLSAIALAPDQRTLAATDIAGLVHVWQLG